MFHVGLLPWILRVRIHRLLLCTGINQYNVGERKTSKGTERLVQKAY